MKTKIVYVLTSNEKDLLLEQLLLSLYSLKYHNPTADVYLVVDQDTFSSIKGCRTLIEEYLADIIKVDAPTEYNNMLRSRWLKTSLRENIEGDFLFVDSDTIVTDSLEECDQWTCDLAAVVDRHIPMDEHHQYYKYICNRAADCGWVFEQADAAYFNSGVMFVKDSKISHDFYKKWHKYWVLGTKNSVFQDQPTLGKTNKEFGYIIHELDGIWNCQIMANGIKFLSKSKIIHYFNAERQSEKKSIFYIPSDKAIYLKIKHDGFKIDEKIKNYIIEGRSAFASNYAVFADEQLVAIKDSFSQYVLKGFYGRNHYYKFLRFLFNVYSFLKR